MTSSAALHRRSMHRKISLIFLFSLALSSCNLALLPTEEVIAEPVQYVEVIITSDPDRTATSTPFQPLPPTNTPLPSPTPSETATPKPTRRPPTKTPWVNNADLPEGQRKILILGSDSRGDGGFRTDVILLLILNPQQGTASAVSFPRDLYVNIPGVGQDRINTAMVYGGFPLLAATFEANFGVRPDSYVLTNFGGFVEIVNSLGGIDVNAAASLTDKCDLPQANWDGYCTVEPGMIGMDGMTPRCGMSAPVTPPATLTAPGGSRRCFARYLINCSASMPYPAPLNCMTCTVRMSKSAFHSMMWLL